MKDQNDTPVSIIKCASVTIPLTRREMQADLARRDAGVNEALEAIRTASALASQESFSYEEVGRLLSVSKRQVQEWVASGDLRAIALPGTSRLRRVSKDTLRLFVKTAELRAGIRLPKPPAL